MSEEWRSAALGDLLVADFDGTWGEEATDGIGFRVIRSTEMRGNIISYNSATVRSVAKKVAVSKRLQPGDILVNKASGSSHLVGKSVLFMPPDDSQYLCSNFVRCLRPNDSVIDCHYLYFATQSPDFKAQIFGAQRTTSGLRNLKISEYKEASISYPISLGEQRRIVEKVQQSIERIGEVLTLIPSMDNDFTALKYSLLFGESRDKTQWKTAAELVDWVKETESVVEKKLYGFAGVRSFGRGVFAGPEKSSSDFQYAHVRRLQEKDFIYPKLMAWEGAFGMVPKGLAGRVVSPEFMVFRAREELILPEILDAYFRSPFCLEDVRSGSTGSNQRRRRLNPKEFLKLKIPVPSMERQIKLREVHRIEQQMLASRLQHENELMAIRDSILRKAFAGEL